MNIAEQREILMERLRYYERSFETRGPEYIRFKQQTIIPKIKRALAKISTGTYGTCDECECSIAELRLILIPAAIHCVDCQSELENT